MAIPKAEPEPEVLEAPADLRDFVAARGERHDHVVRDLRDRVAVPAVRLHARPVRLHDPGRHPGTLARQPGEQRLPHVERDPLVVVRDVDDAVGVIQAAGRGVRRVALLGDALVPVVRRRR